MSFPEEPRKRKDTNDSRSNGTEGKREGARAFYEGKGVATDGN
jgi:hypothetical protein